MKKWNKKVGIIHLLNFTNGCDEKYFRHVLLFLFFFHVCVIFLKSITGTAGSTLQSSLEAKKAKSSLHTVLWMQ